MRNSELGSSWLYICSSNIMHPTPAIAKIINVTNSRVLASIVSYFKNQIKIKVLKIKKKSGSRSGFTCYIAQPIQPNLYENHH